MIFPGPFPHGEFQKPKLDTFTKLANADLTERRKTDPSAKYEDSVRSVAKQFPHLWDKHIHKTGGDVEI